MQSIWLQDSRVHTERSNVRGQLQAFQCFGSVGGINWIAPVDGRKSTTQNGRSIQCLWSILWVRRYKHRRTRVYLEKNFQRELNIPVVCGGAADRRVRC